MSSAARLPGSPTRRQAPGAIGPAVIAQARDRGLITRGRGDTIYLEPALVMPEAMIDRVVEIIAESVHAVLPAG